MYRFLPEAIVNDSKRTSTTVRIASVFASSDISVITLAVRFYALAKGIDSNNHLFDLSFSEVFGLSFPSFRCAYCIIYFDFVSSAKSKKIAMHEMLDFIGRNER